MKKKRQIDLLCSSVRFKMHFSDHLTKIKIFHASTFFLPNAFLCKMRLPVAPLRALSPEHLVSVVWVEGEPLFGCMAGIGDVHRAVGSQCQPEMPRLSRSPCIAFLFSSSSHSSSALFSRYPCHREFLGRGVCGRGRGVVAPGIFWTLKREHETIYRYNLYLV